MKPGQLIDLISNECAVPRTRVAQFLRVLREAELMPKGSSGFGSRDVSTLDAARLTIAVLASDRPNDGPDSVTYFGKLTVHRDRVSGDVPDFLKRDDFAEDLENALALKFEGEDDGLMLLESLRLHIEVGEAEMAFRNGKVIFDRAEGVDVPSFIKSNTGQRARGRNCIYAIDGRDLSQIQFSFARDRAAQ